MVINMSWCAGEVAIAQYLIIPSPSSTASASPPWDRKVVRNAQDLLHQLDGALLCKHRNTVLEGVFSDGELLLTFQFCSLCQSLLVSQTPCSVVCVGMEVCCPDVVAHTQDGPAQQTLVSTGLLQYMARLAAS
jgi:hypothetical protein